MSGMRSTKTCMSKIRSYVIVNRGSSLRIPLHDADCGLVFALGLSRRPAVVYLLRSVGRSTDEAG